MAKKLIIKLKSRNQGFFLRQIFCTMLLWLLLVSCQAEKIRTPTLTLPPTDTFPPATPTPRPTDQGRPPKLTATLTQEADPTSSPSATPVCVRLFYEENAQVELISPQDIRVLVDVYDPRLLSSPANERDILLTTHTHWDHINSEFLESFPGRQLMTQSGVVEAGEVIVQGIPSAHNAGDALVDEGGTNYIYVMEVGGLRIAHFGDIGQDALTPEQLDVLGEVDIAITQLANPYSEMNSENQKGIKLMEQVEPKLIIPTHLNLDASKLAVTRWQGFYSDQSSVMICLSELTDKTSILLMGQTATRFAERLELTKVNW